MSEPSHAVSAHGLACIESRDVLNERRNAVTDAENAYRTERSELLQSVASWASDDLTGYDRIIVRVDSTKDHCYVCETDGWEIVATIAVNPRRVGVAVRIDYDLQPMRNGVSLSTSDWNELIAAIKWYGHRYGEVKP